MAGGYLVEGIDSDWATIERLSREADTVGADAARALRTEALALVRGLPFEGLTGDGYDWIETRSLVGTVTMAIVSCATASAPTSSRPATSAAAEEAARAGLRGAPDEYVLWELGARAIDAGESARALEGWWPRPARGSTPPTSSASAAARSRRPPSRSARAKRRSAASARWRSLRAAS